MKPKLVQNKNIINVIELSNKKKTNLNYIVIFMLLCLSLLLRNRYKSKKSHNQHCNFEFN